MSRYEFTITISGDADDADNAWREAVTALAIDPGVTPEEYRILDENDEEICPEDSRYRL